MLSADHMYSRHNWDKFWEQALTPLSPKQKIFYGTRFAVLKSK